MTRDEMRSMTEAYLEYFARAVYAKAIEDAAKACGAVADRRAKKSRPLSGWSRSIGDQVATADECASAIRALGISSDRLLGDI